MPGVRRPALGDEALTCGPTLAGERERAKQQSGATESSLSSQLIRPQEGPMSVSPTSSVSRETSGVTAVTQVTTSVTRNLINIL